MKGRGGRPPKLREIKEFQGTFRKDREPANVPTAEHAVPEMPPLSGERAEELWRFWIATLGPAGRNVLTVADGAGVAEICEIQAELEERRQAGKGTPATLTAQLRSWCGLYGITPSDRQRIPALPPPGSGKKKLRPRDF